MFDDQIAGSPAGSGHSRLDEELLSRVMSRLGLPSVVSPDLEGLKTFYAAWCRSVPFDNIRKMIALRSDGGAAMPGIDAADFFENWLSNGSGGTCWPSNNAIFMLLNTLGFDARRASGSMFDLPDVNHGTVKVTVDGRDWLVDGAILANVPLPLTEELYIGRDPGVGVEIEYVDGTHIVWIEFLPMSEYVPCRLRDNAVDFDYFHERYETFSRERSPFNAKLYSRKSGPNGATVISGNNEFSKSNGEMVVREFSKDELLKHLKTDRGLSDGLIERWAASGGLDASFDKSVDAGPKLEVPGKRPSRR